MFESQFMQMPGPRDIVIYWPGPRAFSVVQKPRGGAHISVQKPWAARAEGEGMVTGQIDTCISEGEAVQFLSKATYGYADYKTVSILANLYCF